MNELQRAEQDAAGREDLLAELSHVSGERTRLATELETLTEKLATAELLSGKHAATSERLRAGREDALDELKSVEVQFERAMKMVASLKSKPIWSRSWGPKPLHPSD